MDEKTCTKCGETKPLDEFYREGKDSWCKECKRIASRAWNAANKERKRLASRSYYTANREAYLARQAEYYAAHREEDNARRRRYYLANEGKEKARKAKWQQENTGRISAYRKANPHLHWARAASRRSKAHGFTVAIEDFTKADVIKRYGDGCFYCETGAFEHLDHAIPVSKGGPHTLDNVRPSCAGCNHVKSDKTEAEWLAEQAALDDLTEDELEAAIDAEIDRWTQPKESK